MYEYLVCQGEGDMPKGEKHVLTDIYVGLGGCLGKLLVTKNLNF